jgi:hypothetical protein
MEALSMFVSFKTVSSDPAMSTECYKGAKFLLALLESLGLETRLLPGQRETVKRETEAWRQKKDSERGSVRTTEHERDTKKESDMLFLSSEARGS